MSTNATIPVPFGDACARVFLRRVREQGQRSSNRHMVDYLPADVAVVLHAGLLELADVEIDLTVILDDGRSVIQRLAGVYVEELDADLIPIFMRSRSSVIGSTDLNGRMNIATEGFASYLRDHYVDGAQRNRFLVTIASEGNETQKSAQDLIADRALLSLEGLLLDVLDQAEVSATSQLRQVALVYHAYHVDAPNWASTLEVFEEYIAEVAHATPAEQGAKLAMLECFLPDASDTYANGERVNFLEGQDQRRRERGQGRLYDNAMLREFFEETLDDALIDPRPILAEILSERPEQAAAIVDRGRTALDLLDLGTFKGLDPHSKTRKKLAFQPSSLEVVGARSYRRLGAETDTLLVVTSDTKFTIHVGISRPPKAPQTAQLIRWDAKSLKLRPYPVPAEQDRLRFELDAPAEDFEVVRLALATGPRALSGPHDTIDVAIYKGDEPHVLAEARRRLSISDQAWVVEGKPTFELYEGDDIRPLVPNDPADTDGELKSEEDKTARKLEFSDSKLRTQIVEPEEKTDNTQPNSEQDELIELAIESRRPNDARLAKAFSDNPYYLDAVANISQSAEGWEVDLHAGGRYPILPASRGTGRFIYERAVERLLNCADIMRVELSADRELRDIPWEQGLDELEHFRLVRAKLFAELADVARKRSSTLRSEPGVGVPLVLLPLHALADLIEEYSDAWGRAAAASLAPQRYGTLHDALLQLDTLRIFDENKQLERLVVLPTHPWLLAALLHFQTILNRNFHAQPKRKRPLEQDDIENMIPRAAIEDWHIADSRTMNLRLVASAPFHLEFCEKARSDRGESLDYIARIISTKLRRYLDMHPYLRNERRTLRIGFINPGDGKYFLEGLQLWLRSQMPASGLRTLAQDRIPAIDVLLFATQQSDDDGSAFERFFNQQVTAADEDVIRQTLVARLRYRRCEGRGPTSNLHSVHICFARGLVDTGSHSIKTGSLSDGWDGGFGNGLLATYVRKTIPGVTGGRFHSRRGLWVAPTSDGLRGALASILALQRACRDSDVAADKALFWECALPDLKEMRDTYEYSDWVVHLDRELSLELFKDAGDDMGPTIIEYSDQEVPQSPGFDTITATKHADPYYEQLGEILTLADLHLDGRQEDAQVSAREILRDINALSGSWALDFLVGNLADKPHSTRLKGNIGAALVYRWLRRVEAGQGPTSIIETSAGPVVPVYISLEGLIRATPAAGLKRRDGLIHRYSNEVEDNGDARKWCDDILVMYLPKSVPGQPSRLFGRIIEVKLGRSVLGAAGKAVQQVRETNRLLTDTLSGGNDAVDAPFRHKLLSLMLKSQLEQAVAIGAMDRRIYDFLDVPALSSNLATGNYSVDYMIGVDNQSLTGDVFLLHTEDHGEGKKGSFVTRIEEGVRVITLGLDLVEWLAFEQQLSPTLLESPASTRPRLGRYATLQTVPGAAAPPAPPVESAVNEAKTAAPVSSETKPPTQLEPPLALPPVQVTNVAAPTKVPEGPVVSDSTLTMSLAEASSIPVKQAPYPDDVIVDVTRRLERALQGHKVRLAGAPSPREVDRGPRLLRAYVRLEAGESINSLRRSSEDIARVVGTESSDIHISNIPDRHAVALDLPIVGLSYAVDFAELHAHPSFHAAAKELELGFCAGIDVTGRALWADLASMPHMLVAGTTGSGKTIFLRSLILTLLLSRTPAQLNICLSSSKPMDFNIFTKSPHNCGRNMAVEPGEALALAEELVAEMNRRIDIITDAVCDNLAEYNQENPGRALPYIVGVFDEYAAMMVSFSDKDERGRFEGAIGHLAQKARAAGIHLIICMQRPDAAILKGAIKANILHRFALKLPQNQDSRVILDESGAETLLGKGDMLYKDSSGRLARLQVPFLDNRELKRLLSGL